MLISHDVRDDDDGDVLAKVHTAGRLKLELQSLSYLRIAYELRLMVLVTWGLHREKALGDELQ